MLPFIVDKNWYQRYWLTEPPPRPRAPAIRLVIALARHLAAPAAVISGWINLHRQRFRDRELLQAFSDRELWDLGLSRGDIPAVVSGTYHRDGQPPATADAGKTARAARGDKRLDTNPLTAASH